MAKKQKPKRNKKMKAKAQNSLTEGFSHNPNVNDTKPSNNKHLSFKKMSKKSSFRKKI